MAKSSAALACLILLLVQNVGTQELISDGKDDDIHQLTVIQLKRLELSEECEHMYGFLPCTDNLAGHIFLIVVYEYLLFLGEKYASNGSELLFKILGPDGFFGASVFHVLSALPEALILLVMNPTSGQKEPNNRSTIFHCANGFVSGMSKSKEIAQEQVLSGVGLLSGSAIFYLTLLWGTCVIVGKRNFPESLTEKISESSTSNCWQRIKRSPCLTGSGVKTDRETSYTARIMVLSVVPFIIVQIPIITNEPSWWQAIILTSLVVSVLFLLGYFLYQVFQPWIPKRRLEYAKIEHLMIDFLRHVQKQASGKLLTDQGVPNPWAIRRVFERIDQDANKSITPEELQQNILEMLSDKIGPNENAALEDLMKEFDLNQDRQISLPEFLNVFSVWLGKSKHDIYHHGAIQEGSIDEIYRKKIIEYAKDMHLIEISNDVPSNTPGYFLNEDGLTILKGIFVKFDKNGDNCISFTELKDMIHTMELGIMELSQDEVIAKFMKELDQNKDEKLSEKEFVEGFSKWFGSEKALNDFYQEAWKATDKQMDSTGQNTKTSAWTWFTAISLLLLGTAILSFLAEPLIEAVHNFSEAANLPSFYVSFIVIPLATNSREAVSAIKAASSKTPRTTSLTFSEIYGGVIINNVLGLSVLLSLVYTRDLTWNFSSEVLAIIIICFAMGVLASLRNKFPVWMCYIAYILYPFSLVLIYVLNYVYGWS